MKYGWNLDSEKWSQLRQLVDDFVWNRCYLERDYAATVPNTSGVYLICAQVSVIPIQGRVMQQLYNAIYAGQATDLRVRFRQHVQGYGEVRRAIRTFRRLHFWHARVPVQDLNQVEQTLIDTLGPSANEKNVIRARIGAATPAGRIRGAQV